MHPTTPPLSRLWPVWLDFNAFTHTPVSRKAGQSGHTGRGSREQGGRARFVCRQARKSSELEIKLFALEERRKRKRRTREARRRKKWGRRRKRKKRKKRALSFFPAFLRPLFIFIYFCPRMNWSLFEFPNRTEINWFWISPAEGKQENRAAKCRSGRERSQSQTRKFPQGGISRQQDRSCTLLHIDINGNCVRPPFFRRS